MDPLERNTSTTVYIGFGEGLFNVSFEKPLFLNRSLKPPIEYTMDIFHLDMCTKAKTTCFIGETFFKPYEKLKSFDCF